MSQDSNTILQGQLKQKGLHTTRPQFTNILYGTVLQTDVSIAPILPEGASSPIPTGMMTVAVPVLGSNYVTPPILYPGAVAPSPGTQLAVGFTPNGNPICVTMYGIGGGGGGSDFVLAPMQFTFVHLRYGALSACDSVVLDPVNLVPTNVYPTRYSLTVPVSGLGAASTILDLSGSPLQITGVDTTNDSFTLTVYIEVCDDSGANQLILTGTATIAQSGPGQSGQVIFSDLSIYFQSGTDLVFDNVFGIIRTTAGGDYGVYAWGSGGYT